MTTWFSVSDNTATCAITEFNLFSDTTTQMTASTSPELWSVLDGANRGALSAVTFNTNFDASTIGDVFALSA